MHFNIRDWVYVPLDAGRARCEICKARLRYDIGSIMWRCQKRDMCPKHAADEAWKAFDAKKADQN